MATMVSCRWNLRSSMPSLLRASGLLTGAKTTTAHGSPPRHAGKLALLPSRRVLLRHPHRTKAIPGHHLAYYMDGSMPHHHQHEHDLRRHQRPSSSFSSSSSRSAVLSASLRSSAATSSSTSSSSSSSSSSLNVWSFNLRSDFNKETDGKNCWDERKHGVVEMLTKYEPDIIATQECIADQVNFLGDSLSLYDYEGCCRLGDNTDEYCAIFYKKDQFRVKEGDTIWLSQTPDDPGSIGWDAMYPRIATWAVLERVGDLGDSNDGGEKKQKQKSKLVTVISTHFDHVGVEARKNSANLIKDLVTRLKNSYPNSAAVLCGDFNSIKVDNDVYECLTMGEGALVDAWNTAEVKVDGGWKRSTMHKFQGLEFDGCMGDGTVELCAVNVDLDQDKKPSDGTEHIDWILLSNPKSGSPSLKTIKSQVYTDALPSGRYPSDHFPVGAELAFE
eukprot:CAMPEP_0167789972 /NCGR_PEP_ID=MMETSP0111_2-20121227/11026_1 /TAXON_ID=91324 /ORGANISM="Lotharella globosa, Strain CCCM811" /LENGTH=444 /DNA_ID=CAMNT_0007682287 /DNA_START=80 /DNA_END=1414 /DNA_ORIENTATION=-